MYQATPLNDFRYSLSAWCRGAIRGLSHSSQVTLTLLVAVTDAIRGSSVSISISPTTAGASEKHKWIDSVACKIVNPTKCRAEAWLLVFWCQFKLHNTILCFYLLNMPPPPPPIQKETMFCSPRSTIVSLSDLSIWTTSLTGPVGMILASESLAFTTFGCISCTWRKVSIKPSILTFSHQVLSTFGWLCLSGSPSEGDFINRFCGCKPFHNLTQNREGSDSFPKIMWQHSVHSQVTLQGPHFLKTVAHCITEFIFWLQFCTPYCDVGWFPVNPPQPGRMNLKNFKQ